MVARLFVRPCKSLVAAADGIQHAQQVGLSGVVLADDEVKVDEVVSRELGKEPDFFNTRALDDKRHRWSCAGKQKGVVSK